jgi:cytochrome c556
MDKWYQLCGEMRDAAGTLNAQIHAGDKAAAETALANLGKSCESCHETFRVRTAP